MKSLPHDICEHLRNHLFCFLFIEEPDTPQLASFFRYEEAKAGDLLWKEGDPATHVVFLLSGRVAVKKETEFPDRPVVVSLLGPGTVVGAPSLLHEHPRKVTAEVLEDASFLLLTNDSLAQLVKAHPALGVKLLEGMLYAVSMRLSAAYERLAAVF